MLLLWSVWKGLRWWLNPLGFPGLCKTTLLLTLSQGLPLGKGETSFWNLNCVMLLLKTWGHFSGVFSAFPQYIVKGGCVYGFKLLPSGQNSCNPFCSVYCLLAFSLCFSFLFSSSPHYYNQNDYFVPKISFNNYLWNKIWSWLIHGPYSGGKWFSENI